MFFIVKRKIFAKTLFLMVIPAALSLIFIYIPEKILVNSNEKIEIERSKNFIDPIKIFKRTLSGTYCFYNITNNIYSGITYKIDKEAYEDSYDYLSNKTNSVYVPYLDYIDALKINKSSNYDLIKIRFKWINVLLYLMSASYLIILIFFIFFFIKNCIIFIKNHKINNLFIFGIIILILYLESFFVNMSVAAVYDLEYKYIDEQFIILLLSQLLAIFYLIIYFRDKKSVNNRSEH